jgi:hypothetical protein
MSALPEKGKTPEALEVPGLSGVFCWVSEGIRTPDIQIHSLAL